MSKKKNVKQRKCPTNVQLFSKMTFRNVRPSVRRRRWILRRRWIRRRRIRRRRRIHLDIFFWTFWLLDMAILDIFVV